MSFANDLKRPMIICTQIIYGTRIFCVAHNHAAQLIKYCLIPSLISENKDQAIKTIRKRFRFKRREETPIKHLRVNEQIRVPRVVVIGENGEQFGELSIYEAIDKAKELALDLVEVSPKAQPPVCKIMDYGKYLYQQSKQAKVAKAKQKKVEIKGIRLGLRTDTHDRDFKKAQAEKFLRQGNKVKIDIILRGREKAHQDLAQNNLKGFIQLIETPYKIEEQMKRFPGGFNIIIAPISENK